jgi:threonine/homoserine/homoserine lactone efflux protein
MTKMQPDLLGGVLLGLSIAAPIGPVNIAMIQRGLRDGFAGAFLLGVGSTAADLIYILLAYAGADPLSQHAAARVALFGAGALVMGWLGYGAIRAGLKGQVADGAEPPGAARRSAFASGFGITIVNPMTIAFWLGILAASLAARERGTTTMELLYIASLAGGCLLWCAGLAVALHYGRQLARGPALKIVSVVAGLALIGFGIDFAIKAIVALA